MLQPDAAGTLALCGAIAGVGVIIASLETLASWRCYASGGVFDQITTTKDPAGS